VLGTFKKWVAFFKTVCFVLKRVVLLSDRGRCDD